MCRCAFADVEPAGFEPRWFNPFGISPDGARRREQNACDEFAAADAWKFHGVGVAGFFNASAFAAWMAARCGLWVSSK